MKKIAITFMITTIFLLGMSCGGQSAQGTYEQGYYEGVRDGYDMAKEQTFSLLNDSGAVSDIVFDGVVNDHITDYYELGDYVRYGILVMAEDELNNPND